MGAVALAGCSSSSKSKYVQRKEPPKIQTVNATPGTEEQFGEQPKRSHLWTIHWQSGEVSATDKGISVGQLKEVTGIVYREEKGATDFSADRGYADKPEKKLHLIGTVRVTSRANKATLICDSLVYDGIRKLLTATGNVRIEGQTGSVGTFSKLLATPDLKQFGTPDVFSNP